MSEQPTTPVPEQPDAATAAEVDPTPPAAEPEAAVEVEAGAAEADAPAVEAEAPAAEAEAPAAEAEAPAPEAEAPAVDADTPADADETGVETEPAVPAAEGAAAPKPAGAPRPMPPKARPTPAVLKGAPHAAALPVAPTYAGPPPESFGRVDDDGTVFVRDGDSERSVGSYPGATPEEALHYFGRKFDELRAAADLLKQRVTGTDVSAKDGSEALKKLKATTTEPNAVGDLQLLRDLVGEIEAAVKTRRESEAADRAVAKEAARVEREALVSEAEKIAGQPEDKIQWKSSGARMRELLDEWKQHQRGGTRLDKDVESALWQRFSHSRNSFDKARRVHFAHLETSQAEAKKLKQQLVASAEELAKSKDWGPTASAFKRLMDQWRLAGRASRSDDDALWEQFKSAQDSFFNAKDEVVAAEDAEFKVNLDVKEALLLEAEALLPVKDLESTKNALRTIQDKWDKAGKVPRADMQRIEGALRKVETAVREREDQKWSRSNPEVAARAQSMVDQLESSVASLKADLAKAEASGNDRKVKDAKAKLEAQEQWLTQARSGLEEFSG